MSNSRWPAGRAGAAGAAGAVRAVDVESPLAAADERGSVSERRCLPADFPCRPLVLLTGHSLLPSRPLRTADRCLSTGWIGRSGSADLHQPTDGAFLAAAFFAGAFRAVVVFFAGAFLAGAL